MRRPGNPIGKNERRPLPPVEVLLARYVYDEPTGRLIDRIGSKRRLAGSPIGFVTPSGYLRMDMPEGRFLVHRVIWKIVTGDEPPYIIDHRDGDTLNNRFGNMREASDQQNAANAKPRINASSALKGVRFCSFTGRWAAAISAHGKSHWLGRFDSETEAHRAYADAAKRLFGEFARVA